MILPGIIWALLWGGGLLGIWYVTLKIHWGGKRSLMGKGAICTRIKITYGDLRWTNINVRNRGWGSEENDLWGRVNNIPRGGGLNPKHSNTPIEWNRPKSKCKAIYRRWISKSVLWKWSPNPGHQIAFFRLESHVRFKTLSNCPVLQT